MACGRCAAERFSVPPRHVYRQSCTLGLFYLACFISRFVWRLVRFASAPPRHSAQPGLGSTLGAWRADRQVAWDGEGPASVPWVCLAVEALERSGVSSATVCTCTRVPRAWPWVTSPHGFCVGELHRVRLRPQRLFQLKKLLQQKNELIRLSEISYHLHMLTIIYRSQKAKLLSFITNNQKQCQIKEKIFLKSTKTSN